MNDLSHQKNVQLHFLISEVNEGIKGGYKAGVALKKIRDERLWENDPEFESFEDLCKKCWGFSQVYGYRLIEFSDIKQSEIGEHIQNERQARAISQVPEPKRKEVINKVLNHGLKVTSKTISQQIEKQVIELDKIGLPIPQDILPDWEKAEEIREFMTAISKIKCFIEKGVKEEGLIFREVGQTLITDLENTYTGLKRILPHAVCICEGMNKKNCKTCKGRGFISDFLWSITVPKELKEMRLKLIKK